MLIKRMRSNQRGDTIVEVLIAIAVLSFVLGGAFVVTNNSLTATRDTQERGNALKLVQAQLEQLKSLAASDSAKVFGPPPPLLSFCISGVNNVVPSTDSTCAVDSSGTPTLVEPKYKLSISNSGNTFTVDCKWNQVNGHGQGDVAIAYRVYQ